jgi:glycerate 2-kinase
MQAAHAIERGFRAARNDVQAVLCPMADGGEGTIEVFLESGARRCSARVRGPLGDPVDAPFALRDDGLAIVEMAAASGLALLQRAEYDPLRADTFGTGQLIAAALDVGARRLLIGIGGSATNDAGTGMLRALGVRFLNAREDEITGGILSYGELSRIDMSRLDPRLHGIAVSVACDVDNPLTGPRGASHVYAAQKGADATQIEQLDRTLSHIADVTARTTGLDVREVPGAGAAGGLGFALVAFLGAQIERGVRLIARERNLPKLLDGAALCATGEGRIDAQTLYGKTVLGVAELASERSVPVVAFGGSVEPEALRNLEARGIAVRAIAPVNESEAAMSHAAEFLARAAEMFARDYAGFAGEGSRS